MISAITNSIRAHRKYLIILIIWSAILILVVLSLYSGSPSIGRAKNNDVLKSSSITATEHNEGKVTVQVKPLGTDKSRHLTTYYDIMEHRFQERQKLVDQTCQQPTYIALNKPQGRRRFSSIARKRVKWCRIPKVGTTYLSMLEKIVLKGIVTEKTKASVSKKLVFVREPYSRLVSGYIGKIVTNQPWWRSYGTAIVKRFRPRATAKAKMCGNDVTFPEFLKYFIATQVDHFKPNVHWNPLHKICNPCIEQYDFIGHLETFKDDLSHVLKSVNVTVDMDFSDEEQTMRGKAGTIVNQKLRIKRCESMCSALQKVWWSFHARGLISTEIKFPLSGVECDNINGTAFGDLAWDAHIQSMGNIDKYKQRREIMVKLYLQVPLADRIKVRELLMKDFELYGYDSQPADLFPEFT